MNIRRHAGRTGLALALVSLLASLPVPALAAGGSVIPPTDTPFGTSYPEWSAIWWQRYMGTATSDLTGHPCSVQEGDVVLLAGTTGGAETRSCTVAAGTGFLFPLINTECSTFEGNGKTPAELAACAKGIADDFRALHLTVDGKAVAGLSAFRFQSPLFTFVGVAGNPFGVVTEPSKTKAVSDGYWVALTPFTPGSHTIRFGGSAPSFKFRTAATYDITVAG